MTKFPTKILILTLLLLGLNSCIYEDTHPEDCLYDVKLKVTCQSDWLPDYDMTYTKASDLQIAYQIRVFNHNTSIDPVAETTIFSSDFSRKDFTVDLSLHQGDYDIYVWSDVCDSSTGESLFYNSSDFGAISYLTPYVGNSDYKDAFRGATSVSIDYTMYDETIEAAVTLQRPLARYMLIANDVKDFIGSRQSEMEISPQIDYAEMFKHYSARISYPLFMPAVFNNFTNKPIDAWSGISYECPLTVLDDGQVLVGMDYVMINGGESNVQVSLEIMDETHKVVSVSGGTINIPIVRDRTTKVFGKFLTTPGEGDVTLNPEFKGQHNIEIN